MRRTLLALVLIAATVAPLSAASLGAVLPACCRMAGMHHCAGTTAAFRSDARSSPAQGCPYAPSLRSDRVLRFAPAAHSLAVSAPVISTVATAAETLDSTSSPCLHRDRAPPLLAARSPKTLIA